MNGADWVGITLAAPIGWGWLDRGAGRADCPASDWLNNLFPATENVPIIKTRITHTMIATNTGTTLMSVPWDRIDPPNEVWLKMAMATPQ